MASHTQVVVFEVLCPCSIDMVAVTLGAEILVRDMQFFDIGHNDRLSDCRLVDCEVMPFGAVKVIELPL